MNIAKIINNSDIKIKKNQKCYLNDDSFDFAECWQHFLQKNKANIFFLSNDIASGSDNTRSMYTERK